MKVEISCPVDNVKVSEAKVRLTAALVFISGLLFVLLSAPWWIALFLTMDFSLRAFGQAAYSPLNLLSGWIEKLLPFQSRQVDRAPKIFAAKLGLALSAILLLLSLTGFYQTASYTAAILLLFSFLESSFGFCVGCYIYTFMKKIS